MMVVVSEAVGRRGTMKRERERNRTKRNESANKRRPRASNNQ